MIFTGYMFLPVRFAIDFPMVPPMDKHVVPVLTVMAATMLVASLRDSVPHQPGLLPKSMLARALIAMLLLGAVGTAVTNGDRIVTPLDVKQGLRLYDGVSVAISYALTILPVLLGRKFFASPETHRLILIVFCVAACGYALLALYEIRMSPGLNRSVYGFTPHSWRQHVRGGGFRPMVFMEHGLRVSLFFAMALIAAVGLFRMGWKTGPMLLAIGWLFVTVVLSKSLGALIIALLIIPMVFFLSTRMLILAAAVIAMTVLTYPMLRGGGYVPVDRITSFANSIDAQRAASFTTRLENEDLLLERAAKRPIFGWGGFGRSRVRNEKGHDIVIPDGYWVIIIGVGGWSRYLGEFGLMTVPMLFLFLQRGRMQISRDTAILSIILAGNMIDLIPNSGQTPITWLIAGALWGRLEYKSTDKGDEKGGDPPPDDRTRDTEPRYARDFGTRPPPRRANGQRAIQARYTRYTGDHQSKS
ncbi:hypothetical protein [uncultured Roseobacter sp.]|uniref:hypothetical protein n=1 Tax=uncultured Roseobacter sp. TaxID=114847 RepID=UPI002616EC63|nr:hypothetical protein [uncultured Roseobacter sp.]